MKIDRYTLRLVLWAVMGGVACFLLGYAIGKLLLR